MHQQSVQPAAEAAVGNSSLLSSFSGAFWATRTYTTCTLHLLLLTSSAQSCPLAHTIPHAYYPTIPFLHYSSFGGGGKWCRISFQVFTILLTGSAESGGQTRLHHMASEVPPSFPMLPPLPKCSLHSFRGFWSPQPYVLSTMVWKSLVTWRLLYIAVYLDKGISEHSAHTATVQD